MDSFKKRLKEFRTGRDSNMNKNSLADLFEEQENSVSNLFEEQKNGIVDLFEEHKSSIANSFEEHKGNIADSFEEHKNNVTSSLEEHKNSVTSSFEEHKSNVSNSFEEHKNSVADLFEEQNDYINESLSNRVPQYNIMYVDPSLDASPENHLFNTYSEAKKYILDNLPAASDTNKYLIKLPAGETDDIIAGDSITGEEGCIHLDSNIILDCNDAAVITCPLKSNGLIADISTEGFALVYRYYVKGGVFTDIQGVGSIFSFCDSVIYGLDLDSAGLILNTGTTVQGGSSINTMMFNSESSRILELEVSFHKNNFASDFRNTTAELTLLNPTDSSETVNINCNNSSFTCKVEGDLNYDFYLEGSKVDFNSETVSGVSIKGLDLVNSTINSGIDLEILGNVSSIASGIDTSNAVTFSGDYTEIHDIYAGTLNLSKGVIVYNKFIVDSYGSLTGKLDIHQKHNVQSVIADGSNVQALPTSKVIAVDTSSNTATIVIPVYLQVEGYEVVIIDTGDASVNNISIEDEIGTVLGTISTGNGSMKLYYTGTDFIN